MQTVHLLHVGSITAHLDITSSNIMHCTEGHHVWDQLRLVDFGFSQICTKGKLLQDFLLLTFSCLVWHQALRSCAHWNKQFVQPNCCWMHTLDACNCVVS